jgi:hypothetical protein
MVNKRGFLRIVEASIAVLIVLGVILFVSFDTEKVEGDLSDRIPPILDEIAKDVDLREKLWNDEAGSLVDMEVIVADRLGTQAIGYAVVICPDINSLCGGLGSYPQDAAGSIFSAEGVISTNLESATQPKKIKIYLWRKI